jgi:IclR family transcriptional regulator, mhp operon transcriptional activator
LSTTQLHSGETRVSRGLSSSELEIQSLLKGLRIIEAVNQCPGMILAQIAVRCGLPRTTAHRALRTLEQNGFIYREEATGRFYAHRRVLGLSSGFDPLAQATALVRDQFAQVGPKIGWPMHFSTPVTDVEAPKMQVEASTDYVSPLAVDKLLPGHTIPLLQCAAGLAWLSSRNPAERTPIIERAMRNGCERAAQKRWTMPVLEETLGVARNRGFADYYWLGRHTNMVGLSVPVQVDGQRAGALTVRFAESAVPVKEAIARFVPMLRDVASLINHRARHGNAQVTRAS